MLVERFQAQDMTAEWNAFVADSKNGTFLFNRGYMDYHADRFEDYSLVVRLHDGGRPIALLPANVRDRSITTHAGLTYGGFVTDRKMNLPLYLEMFGAVLDHLRTRGMRRFRYKAVPHIYHAVPAEEEIYALFRWGAHLTRVDASSAIDLRCPISWSKSKRQGIAKAMRAGISIEESQDYTEFMKLVGERLRDRYGISATHTEAEIRLLAGRFSKEIRLFTARLGADLIAGIMTYACGRTVHAQYMAASACGLEHGALDAIVHHIVSHLEGCVFFDFGISTEDDGRHLNAGLVRQKEMFGARTIAYPTYELDVIDS